jgi:hypothetical protein
MSGITAHVRGWDVGVRAHCYAAEDGSDHCAVWITTGSNGRGTERLLATVTQDGAVTLYEPASPEQAAS